MYEADFSEAKAFADLMHPSEQLTFQLVLKPEDKPVEAKILHGTLEEHWDTLQEWNSRTANVYCMVNRGNGKGRTAKSVTAITSVFADLDGSPLDPLLDLLIKPHVIVGTSPGRYQGHWRIQPIEITPATRDQSRTLFYRMQQGIATRFNGDSSVSALAQVARLPGFFNYKHGMPFRVVRHLEHDSPEVSVYELAETLDIDPTTNPVQASCHVMPVDALGTAPIFKGTRGITLFRIARLFAYKGILGDNLLQALSDANISRCVPPVRSDRLENIVRSVSNHWQRNSVPLGELVQRIVARNYRLSAYKGNFYRYDQATREYRMIELRALISEVFRQTNKTAGRFLIDQVLAQLADQVPSCDPSGNTEQRFIKECIVVGGKVILRDVYRRYESWCDAKGLRPTSQSQLRKEIEILYPGCYRKNVRAGHRQHRGFYGLSLRVLLLGAFFSNSYFLF